jgi:hypothetical protein
MLFPLCARFGQGVPQGRHKFGIRRTDRLGAGDHYNVGWDMFPDKCVVGGGSQPAPDPVALGRMSDLARGGEPEADSDAVRIPVQHLNRHAR